MGNDFSKIAPLRMCLDNVCKSQRHCVAYAGDHPVDYQLNWVRRFNINDPEALPWAVIRPHTTEEVSRIVQCAIEHNATVQAKGGGHSYANYAYNANITIDLTHMKHVQMTRDGSHNVQIGGGARLGKIDQYLNMHHRAFAHGVCPGVGLGGHATIGGLGPMSRM